MQVLKGYIQFPFLSAKSLKFQASEILNPMPVARYLLNKLSEHSQLRNGSLLRQDFIASTRAGRFG